MVPRLFGGRPIVNQQTAAQHSTDNNRANPFAAEAEMLPGSRASKRDCWPHPRQWQRDHWVLAGFLCFATVLVASIVPGFASASLQSDRVERIRQPLALPAPVVTVGGTSRAAVQWKSVTIAAGQTLGDVFSTLGVPGQDLHQLLDYPGAREALSRIRPGDRFDFDIASNGRLQALRFERDEAHRVVLRITRNGVREQVQEQQLQHRTMLASGVIEDSLYGAAENAGMSVSAIMELAKAFGYDIDFAQDLREGDQFHVMYEEIWRDGERLRSGDILAASFVNQGKRYEVLRYVFPDGHSEYYDAEGRPMKKSFLRMPVDFARISSRFTSARRHPVLGITRAHQGVDYATGTGTPIMAAGDGRIVFAGWKGGYGRAVIVQHGGNVTTLYGHMSRFSNLKTGARVRQGDVIGYVGASGLASGPHLHYEFRIAGVHRDPLSVTMPKPEPLPRSELARFQLQTQPLVTQLAMHERSQRFAAR